MAVTSGAQVESVLLNYGRTIWRRKVTIVIVTLLAAGIAFAISARETPVYQATAQVLLQPSAEASALSVTPATVNVPNDISLIESPAIARLVTAQIGSAPPVIASSEAANPDVLDVTVNGGTSREVARAANAYARAFLSYQRNESVQGILGATKSLESRISATQLQISGLQKKASSESGALYASTEAQVTALEQQLTTLSGELSSLQSNAILGSSTGELISPATAPHSPVSPQKVRDTLLGFGGGLLFGIALAFVRENLDDTITSKEELGQAQPALPLLAEIPHESHGQKAINLVSASRPQSPGAEAYRSLRTSIQFLSLERSLKTIQVTSPRSGDGKTTTVANLAIALARAGQRIIVVDCDLRRPKLHEAFALSTDVGFTSVLLGEVPISAALQEVPGLDGMLQVLTSGPRLANPSELLSSRRTSEVLASLGVMADLTLIDTAPVLPVTDAVSLAPRVDAVAVVISSGRTTTKELARSLELLGQVSAPVVGTVLNSVTSQGRYHYRYRDYHYGSYKALPQDFPSSSSA